ncbi:MAG: ribosome maturation factor RimP [Candidatus Portiera sp.]|nr:ribosome maturation factor RimP [Portiera sp.]
MKLISDNLQAIIRSQIESMGYILWGIEIIPRKYSYLTRIYIDSQEKKSLGIEDCALVNRALDACLQEEDMQLEVSTPGLARKLFFPEQYSSYLGKKIRIRTKKMIEGRKNFNGELVDCDANSLTLSVDDTSQVFSYSDVSSSQLEPNYDEIFKK